jgi:PAS domain S-box-containing protein
MSCTKDSPVEGSGWQLLFESSPGLLLVLDPGLYIVAVSNGYLAATMTRREQLLGRHMFDAFPDNPQDPEASGVANLGASLQRVLEKRLPDRMPVQKYDVRRPPEAGGEFEVRYWAPLNTPVLDHDGELRFIIHRVEDVTDLVRLQHEGRAQEALLHELRAQIAVIERALQARERELAARETELVAREREQLQMMGGLPGLVWTATAAAQVDYLGPQWERYTGLAPERLRGEDWLEVVHPQDRAGVLAAWHEAVRRHELHVVDCRLRRHDGVYRWFHVSGLPLRDEAGVVVRWFGICIDIDDLQEALATLRATFDQAGIGIAYIDQGLTMVQVNRALAAMVGYAPEELQGMPLATLSYAEDRLISPPRFDQLFKGEVDSFTVEKRYQCKDGRVIWVRLTASAVRDPGTGEVLFGVKFVQDITPRKQAMAEVSAFFRQAAVGVYVVDLDGRVLRSNDHFRALLGYGEGELEGMNLAQLCHADDLEAKLEKFRRLVAGEIGEYSIERRYRRRDGSFVWCITSTARGSIEPGIRPYAVSVVIDIEERRHLEQELRRSQQELEARVEERTRQLREAQGQAEAANQAKTDFLATMSHEIRTPLNGVIGFTGLLLDGALTEDKRRYAELARQSGESLLHLLNDFLDFTKIEAGRLELEPVPFDLQHEMQQVLALMQQQAEAKGLELKLHLDAPRQLVGDVARLRQILLNLLSNAIKFTARGHVLLCCEGVRREGSIEVLCFEVVDTGIGIDEATCQKLFQPFTQASHISRRYGGTGLGLVICRRLTELMGGEIGFHSEPEKGSVFWVELPFELGSADGAADALSMPEAQAAAEAGAPRGRVLVAEDNAVSQLLAAEVLRRLGCQVDVAGNGREAVDAFRQLPYDLVLMDCDMPVMDGFEATRQIRALEAGTERRVPIVAMTASAMQGDPERCLQAGMDEFLSKPLRLPQLRQVINTWLTPG